METLADALQARSCAYRLLAFFMALPTRDVADSVLAGSLRADVEEIADGVTEALDAENSFWQLDAEEALRALRLDYTMLFTNPEGAVVSPYEACFKGSDDFDSSGLTFISPTALDAERVYRQLGIKPSGHSNESADHMGVETEFLGLVYEQLAGAVDDSGNHPGGLRPRPFPEVGSGLLLPRAERGADSGLSSFGMFGRCFGR